ncbi:MAG: hypothetical protein JSU63_01465 [Phycisphaerales bacterium]|nr:MAG: hypothetical protein JSU63_01465 [Phycisphaerales bacterium]
MSTCNHSWSMVNIRNGYLVIEGCHECRARTSFFSMETVPPVDDYRDGEHFWTYLGSFQAVKFDLSCEECGEIVNLNDMMGLMLSTCRDPDCEVGRLATAQGKGTWVYVALCADSSHATGKCVSDAGVKALGEYFNANIKDPDKKVVVVPCRMCNSIDTCEGIVIADTGLTEIY